MSFGIETRNVGDVKVVEIIGKLVLGKINSLDQVIEEQLELGWRRILLNMRRVKEIDEAAIRGLHAIERSMYERGAQLKLSNAENVEGFTLTAMAGFDIHEDEPAGIRSFITCHV